MSLSGIGEIASLVEDGIDRIFGPSPSETQKAEAQLLKTRVQNAVENASHQLDVNKAEANNPNLFVSGWRPAVGWACAASFAWTFMAAPALSFIAAAVGHPVDVPALDMGQMMPVLLGMLGLGGMRSFERARGIDSKSKGNG